MKISIHTSDDYFQHYIPLFAYCMNKTYPMFEIHATINGKTDELTKEAADGMPMLKIIEAAEPLKNDISTVSTNRFLSIPPGDWLICDADILIFHPGLIDWFIMRSKQIGAPYYAIHGVWKRPARFPGSWYGDLERICGGFVYVTDKWLQVTKLLRESEYERLRRGEIGVYREEDEVTFCNICKKAGLPISQEQFYPPDFRGVHLGDFKPSMQHRFTNKEKMSRLMTRNVFNEFKVFNKTDTGWNRLKSILYKDDNIKQVFENLEWYLEQPR